MQETTFTRKPLDLGDTTQREALLKLLTEKDMPSSTTQRMTEEMRGKSNEEKERLAAKYIAEIQNRTAPTAK